MTNATIVIHNAQASAQGDVFEIDVLGTQGYNVGLFTDAPGMAIPGNVKMIHTAGYRTIGKGGAQYIHDAAVNAAFVAAHPGWSFLAGDGRGFRLSDDQMLTFEMFGAYGDYNTDTGTGTDDFPRWLVARDFLHHYAKTLQGNPYYKSVPALTFDRAAYYFSDAIDLTDGSYRISGHGGRETGATTIYFAAGKCGFILQSWDSTGVNGTKPNTPSGANETLISDIAVISKGGSVGAEQHGFLVKCHSSLVRCVARNFGGHGFYIRADINAAGNANQWRMEDCTGADNGGCGLCIDGGDVNGGTNYSFNGSNNGLWGIWDSSFLGNEHSGYHLDGNGTTVSGPTWATVRRGTLVSYNGQLYRVRPGQQVAASTTVPGTNSNIWYPNGSGGPTVIQPTWVSGMSFVSGGAIYCDDPNCKSVFAHGYMESNQAPGWLDAGRAMAIGGFQGFSFGAQVNAHDHRMWTPQIGTTLNNGGGVEIKPSEIEFPGGNLLRAVGGRLEMRSPLDSSVSMIRLTAGEQHPYALVFPNGTVNGSNFRKSAAAMPSSGAYTRGAFIENEQPSVSSGKVLLGWVRLTTGSGHVLNTDWAACYATTS